jgi:hypothetical protein
VEPFFAGSSPIYLSWDEAGAAVEGEAPALPPGAATRVLDMAEIELYMRCPRLYEYDRAIGLSEPEEGLAYKHFNSVVQRVLAQLRQLGRDAALPTTAAEVQALLDAMWLEYGPRDHVHSDLYARIAADMVRGYWQRLGHTPAGPAWQEEIITEIGGAPVRLKLGVAEETEDGALRVTQIKAGRPRDDDSRVPRLSVLRRSIGEQVPQGREVRIELQYLSSGETVPVKATRYEADRVRKVEEAVAGIRAGRFPAAPAEDDYCLTCPFWIICPR